MKQIDEWVAQALIERGIRLNSNGTLLIEFFKGKTQVVADVASAIRQQKHIVDQQKKEQKENEEFGALMRKFNDAVEGLKNMSVEEFQKKRTGNILRKLTEIITIMKGKREDLRKDGCKRLENVLRMLEEKNIPAAVWASNAAIDRMRKRWLVNEKVIDKSLARLSALQNLKK